MSKEVYVLLADRDGTMRSSDEPFGVAVTSEEEAIRYMSEGGIGYSQSYTTITIFDNKDDAIKFKFPNIKINP